MVVDIVFLARYEGGELEAIDAAEVEEITWLAYDEIMADGRAMPWTRESLKLADSLRRERGW